MKNTMKKLLCMALAIMLLVSAVPVFAAAVDDVSVTFKNQKGDTVGTWTYNPETDYGVDAEPNWDGASEWALGEAIKAGVTGLNGRSVVSMNAGNPHAVIITVSNLDSENASTNPPANPDPDPDPDPNPDPNPNPNPDPNPDPNPNPMPEKEVVVTFRLPGGSSATWRYKPSDYATEGNDGTPNWTEGAAVWAMNEAVKANALNKGYDNAVLASVTDNGYAATITLSDNAQPIEPIPTTTQVTFVAKNNAGETVTNHRDFTDHEVVSNEKLPSAPLRVGYKFMGWYSGQNGTGEHLAAGDKWSGEYTTYYAWYKESKTEDGMSTLSVYLRRYVGGVQQGSTELLYTHDFVDNKSDSLLTWLQNNETRTSNAIFGKYSAEEYEWAPRYYYNYSGNEPLTSQNLVANGDKSVVVKIYAKSTAKATVLVYAHPSKTSSSVSVYEMPGYKAGNTVTLSAVKNFLNNTKITGLYSDAAWAQLKNGENPTAANGIAVEDNGILRIHVIGSAKSSSSKADSSNPKTGDTIFVPVMVMGLTASALAAAYIFGKKRFVR